MTNRETAARLTGAIFIPGVAANWFQQEAMVRHGQSDVRNKTRKWCEEPEAGGLTVDSRSGKKNKKKQKLQDLCYKEEVKRRKEKTDNDTNYNSTDRSVLSESVQTI